MSKCQSLGFAIMLAIIAGLLTSACTGVEPASESETVRLAEPSQISNCQFAGITTVSVKVHVTSHGRDSDRVRIELQILAKNEAVKLKGNTIVPATGIKDDEQTFNIYRCQY
jgi:hypothetical protein